MSRKERESRFLAVKTGGYSGLSPMLVHCGLVELQMALEDRRTPGLVLELHNHGSSHSLGSILLLVAGFEAWLNECMASLFFADPSARGELVRLSTWDKYLEIPRRLSSVRFGGSSELRALLNLRNEIAHYLPFYTGIGDDPVPNCFRELQQKGLFITSPQGGDFDFTQKLSSYRLAYWAWSAVETALGAFLRALGSHGTRFEWTAENFYDFRSISSPDQLPVFDKQASQSSSNPHTESLGKKKATASFLLRPRRRNLARC